MLRMKTSRLVFLVLVAFTNQYNGSTNNQEAPHPVSLYRKTATTTNNSTTTTTTITTTTLPNLSTTVDTNVTATMITNLSTTADTNATGNKTVIPKHNKIWSWEKDVYFALLILFVPIVTIGNLVVVIVVFSARNLRNQPMYLFLASLAIADCLIGIFLFPMRAKHEQDGANFKIPTFLCWLFWLCDPLINLVSILHFLVVAIDRYLALKYTYAYSNMVTRRRALIIIALIWTISVVWILIGVPQWTTLDPKLFARIPSVHKLSVYNVKGVGCGWVNPNFHITTLVLWILLPIVLLFFLYAFIYRTALRHVNEISRLHIGDAEQVRRKKQLQLVRSIVGVFVSYALCWVPTAVFSLWVYNNMQLAIKLIRQRNTSFDVLTFFCTRFFTVVCPNANPFIYVLTNTAFVTALQRLFKRITGIHLGKKDDSIMHSEVTKQTDEFDDSYRMKDRGSGKGAKYVTGSDNKGIDNDEGF